MFDSQALCGMLPPLCMLWRRYAAIGSSMCAISVSMWDVAATMWAVASYMWDVTAFLCYAQALRGLLRPTYRLLHHPCMMHKHYVVYCVLFVGYCSLYVGCYRRLVEYKIMCACCTGVMWDVTASMHGVQALCGLLRPLWRMLRTLCGLSLAKIENVDRERRQGTKKRNKD